MSRIMTKFFSFSFMLVFIFLSGGCAQGYYALNPNNIAFNASNNLEYINLNYRYDILEEKGNTKLAKKARKRNIKLVAVQITNNTDKVINIGDNVAFYSGNTMMYPMDAVSVKNNLKQSVAGYLFYMLLTPLNISFNGAEPVPVGLLIGPVITGSNMIVAGSANKNLYKELLQYDVLSRDIRPRETVFGLVGFRNMDYVPLTLKFIK